MRRLEGAIAWCLTYLLSTSSSLIFDCLYLGDRGSLTPLLSQRHGGSQSGHTGAQRGADRAESDRDLVQSRTENILTEEL
jgi:hypothetical protein